MPARSNTKKPAPKVSSTRMLEALGLGGVVNAWKLVTRLTGIAEAEIAAAKRRWPASAHRIDVAFRFACPPPCLRGKVDDVYVHHVRELIDRARETEDEFVERTRPVLGMSRISYNNRFLPATKAEVLCSILDASLASPLRGEYVRLADALWVEIMPGKPIPTPEGNHAPVHTEWTDETAALLAELRATCRDRSREEV